MTKISPYVSILNRVTGVALSGMFVLSGTCLAFGKKPLDHYSKLPPWQKTVVNYGVLFPTIYHAFGGIRHMVWDKYPKLLHNSAVHRSSILLISSSLITTILSEKFVINKNLENVFRPRNYKEIDVSGLIEEEIINIPDICN